MTSQRGGRLHEQRERQAGGRVGGGTDGGVGGWQTPPPRDGKWKKTWGGAERGRGVKETTRLETVASPI